MPSFVGRLKMSGNKRTEIIVKPTNPTIIAGPTHGAKLLKKVKTDFANKAPIMLPNMALATAR
jgi:hypothetical protein